MFREYLRTPSYPQPEQWTPCRLLKRVQRPDRIHLLPDVAHPLPPEGQHRFTSPVPHILSSLPHPPLTFTLPSTPEGKTVRLSGFSGPTQTPAVGASSTKRGTVVGPPQGFPCSVISHPPFCRGVTIETPLSGTPDRRYHGPLPLGCSTPLPPSKVERSPSAWGREGSGTTAAAHCGRAPLRRRLGRTRALGLLAHLRHPWVGARPSRGALLGGVGGVPTSATWDDRERSGTVTARGFLGQTWGLGPGVRRSRTLGPQVGPGRGGRRGTYRGDVEEQSRGF